MLGLSGGVVVAAMILESSLLRAAGNWRILLGIVLLALILFGPLAPIFVPYLPIPAINVADSKARVAQPIVEKAEAELYDWVRQNTDYDAFFYWCDLEQDTMLQFRRQAGRSITVNWKDLNLASKNMTSLLFFYNRYRQLEAACQELDSLVAMAYTLEADFILVPAAKAVGVDAERCFSNERYALFPVGNMSCFRQQVRR
jgi:hypothetical protein